MNSIESPERTLQQDQLLASKSQQILLSCENITNQLVTQRSSALNLEQEMKAVDIGLAPDNRPFEMDLPKF